MILDLAMRQGMRSQKYAVERAVDIVGQVEKTVM